MSDQNGRSSTAIEVDGIVFDLNRISKREYIGTMQQLGQLGENDYDKSLNLSSSLYAKIIVSWPYGKVTAENYANLGVMDAGRVDAAFAELGEILKKKRLERLSTFLPDTSSPSATPLPNTNIPA